MQKGNSEELLWWNIEMQDVRPHPN